ncbi:hypothetical protein N7517_007453 [Penicillium concentricum]|uniref:Ankyrin n=1 Tax=Penicillium concentricum TaxID=293559 RepID=A0A9W9VB30_9EURO|nr:uncharacterized protein N7517_007453 [Penicillium concentricum]KAJ5375447.1 hypothetical protein N7517_007453 [Penicillium concentricum]
MPAPQTPLYAASFYGCWKAVETLISLKATLDIHDRELNWTPLLTAASFGHLRTVQMLLEAKADPNEICGKKTLVTPLCYAATRGASIGRVQALLNNGADPNLMSLTDPLGWMISTSSIPSQKKIAILDILANNSPSLNIDGRSCYGGRTALMEAVEKGERDMVEWLLNHRASVMAIDKLGETALFPAVREAHIDILRELLKQERPLHTINGKGEGLLQLAGKDTELVNILLDAGAFVEGNDDLPRVFTIVDGGGKVEEIDDADLDGYSDTSSDSSLIGLDFSDAPEFNTWSWSR